MKQLDLLKETLQQFKNKKVMKNIHILKTNKPSRLLKDLVDGTYQFKKEVLYGNRFELPLSIYITSDEDIKEGDYYITILENEVYKATKETQNIMSVANLIETTSYKKTHFKIILTTDPELIKNGVQAIDDEFLEWFVNNSSCEEIGVKKYENGKYWTYEIIIPKEKPEQETVELIVYNIGDNIRIINPTENQPKLFTTHKVDNNFGVVYYYHLDGKEESIGFSYIRKEELKQETLINDTDSHSWGFENFEVIKTEEDAKIFIEALEKITEPNEKLKKILENVLEEHGEDTQCRIEVTGRFPHNLSSNIVLTNKK